MNVKLQNILKYSISTRISYFQIVEKYINPESRIADFGCGVGLFAETIKRNDVYQIDSNINTITFLQKKYKNVYKSDSNVLPFSNDFFDLIHCSHVIEHLYPMELYALLCEFNRCLKPGGYIVISAPLMHPGFYDDLSHIKPYSPYVIIKYLTNNSDENLTREKISSDYTIEQQVNRYAEVSLENLTYNVSSLFVDKIFQKAKKLIYNLGFRRFIINGYTIVLKKDRK